MAGNSSYNDPEDGRLSEILPDGGEDYGKGRKAMDRH